MLDAFGAYDRVPHDRLQLAPWDGHPNARGHELLARHLYPQLAELLGAPAEIPAGAR